jgi:hypothetical protein
MEIKIARGLSLLVYRHKIQSTRDLEDMVRDFRLLAMLERDTC